MLPDCPNNGERYQITMVTISPTSNQPYDGIALGATKITSSSDASAIAGSDVSTSKPESATVSLSGKSMMIYRMFNHDAAQYSETVTAKNDDSLTLTSHLTKADRDLLGNMYEYASDNNIDLNHVDAFATDLASYRAHDASTYDGNYDAEGHKLTVTMKASESAIAQNIKGSGDMSQSSIDQGFLASEIGRPIHMVNMDFLQRVVSVFSSNSEISTQAKNSETAIAQYNFELSRPDVTASKDVQLVILKADSANVDDVSTSKTPELAATTSEQLRTQSKTNQIMSFLRDFALHKNIDESNLNELKNMFAKSDIE